MNEHADRDGTEPTTAPPHAPAADPAQPVQTATDAQARTVEISIHNRITNYLLAIYEGNKEAREVVDCIDVLASQGVAQKIADAVVAADVRTRSDQ